MASEVCLVTSVVLGLRFAHTTLRASRGPGLLAFYDIAEQGITPVALARNYGAATVVSRAYPLPAG